MGDSSKSRKTASINIAQRILRDDPTAQPRSTVCGNAGSHRGFSRFLGSTRVLTCSFVLRRLDENPTGNVEGPDAVFGDTGRAGGCGCAEQDRRQGGDQSS